MAIPKSQSSVLWLPMTLWSPVCLQGVIKLTPSKYSVGRTGGKGHNETGTKWLHIPGGISDDAKYFSK